MIRVTIELIPHGIGDPETVGVVEIVNNGTSKSLDTGNYDVKLLKSPKYAKTPGVWKRGQVLGFKRLVHGPYDLLYLALKAALGTRVEALHKCQTTDKIPKPDGSPRSRKPRTSNADADQATFGFASSNAATEPTTTTSTTAEGAENDGGSRVLTTDNHRQKVMDSTLRMASIHHEVLKKLGDED